MGKKRSTIKDVAVEAGVSATTVSHVLNETRYVSEQVKENVYRAIDKLKYKPNHIARSLRGAGTKAIGVIIADIREEFFGEIVKSIEKYCNKYDYIVYLCDSEDKIEKESKYIQSLLAKDVDGIILSPIYSNTKLSSLIDADIPIVQIDRYSKNIKSCFIGINNKKSAFDATNYLIDNGSENILFIGYNDNVYTQKLRREGFIEALDLNEKKVNYNIISLDYMDNDTLCCELGHYLENSRQFDTVFCTTGKLCYNFLKAAMKKNLLESQQLKILTYDNSKWLDLLKYPILSIKQPTELIGELAAEKMLELLNAQSPIKPESIHLNTELLIR